MSILTVFYPVNDAFSTVENCVFQRRKSGFSSPDPRIPFSPDEERRNRLSGDRLRRIHGLLGCVLEPSDSVTRHPEFCVAQ